MKGMGMLRFISYPMGGQIQNVKKLAEEWKIKLSGKVPPKPEEAEGKSQEENTQEMV